MGSKAVPRKILFLDPILGWADLPMVLCMIFAHGFGCNGFRSMVLEAMVFGPWYGHDGFQFMVLDASACINMYCNIERNIMKNKSGSPNFVIHGKICVYMCFMYYALALFIFCVLEFICSNFCTGLKPTFGIGVVLASKGHLCC